MLGSRPIGKMIIGAFDSLLAAVTYQKGSEASGVKNDDHHDESEMCWLSPLQNRTSIITRLQMVQGRVRESF